MLILEGQILNVDMAHYDWKIIGRKIYKKYGRGWGRPVIGADKCIYFLPCDHDRILQFNPSTQNISLIGESYGEKKWKWRVAVLASDGFIYCLPSYAHDILQIDSRHFNEQVVTMIESLNVIEIFND